LNIFCFFSSNDDLAPALPPKRDPRPVKSSATIISNRSRSNGSMNSLVLSSSSNKIKQDKDNDERIQLIVDDINQIVEKYTRELDDALRTKTAIRSSSIDHLSEQNRSTYRHNSIDTLYETNVSKIMKSTITKTTVNNGQGIINKKESCQIYDGTDCSIHSPNGNFKTQKLTFINRQKSDDDNEQQKTIMTSQINQLNVSETDAPPLPPKRKTGFFFFDIYLQHRMRNHAKMMTGCGAFDISFHLKRVLFDGRLLV
jgi:hypothetical protein